MKYIYSLSCLLLTIFYASCREECETVKKSYAKLNTISLYNGFDTLKFLHNNTDTQVYIGSGPSYFWSYERYDETLCSRNTDWQGVSYLFKCLKNSNTIGFVYNAYPYNYSYYLNGNQINRARLWAGDIKIGDKDYKSVYYEANSLDTISYFAVSWSDSTYGLILKVKNSNDTLILLK